MRAGHVLRPVVVAFALALDVLQHVLPERVTRLRVYERVLDVEPVRLVVVAAVLRVHVAEHDAVALQQVLERPQAHVVEVREHAAEPVQVHGARRVHAEDLARERAVALEELRVVLPHEALVVRVRPQHVRPLGETLAPAARPTREARRQSARLPALVDVARDAVRSRCRRLSDGRQLCVRREAHRAAVPHRRTLR